MERDTPAGRGRLDGLRSGGAVREIACSFEDEPGQLRGEIGGVSALSPRVCALDGLSHTRAQDLPRTMHGRLFL